MCSSVFIKPLFLIKCKKIRMSNSNEPSKYINNVRLLNKFPFKTGYKINTSVDNNLS